MFIDYEKRLDSWGVPSTANSAVRIMSTVSSNTEAVDESKEIMFFYSHPKVQVIITILILSCYGSFHSNYLMRTI